MDETPEPASFSVAPNHLNGEPIAFPADAPPWTQPPQEPSPIRNFIDGAEVDPATVAALPDPEAPAFDAGMEALADEAEAMAWAIDVGQRYCTDLELRRARDIQAAFMHNQMQRKTMGTLHPPAALLRTVPAPLKPQE